MSTLSTCAHGLLCVLLGLADDVLDRLRLGLGLLNLHLLLLHLHLYLHHLLLLELLPLQLFFQVALGLSRPRIVEHFHLGPEQDEGP